MFLRYYLVLMLLLTGIRLFGQSGSGQTIIIGRQEWMAHNLDVDHYTDGTPILEAKTIKEWRDCNDQHIGCWCYYDNQTAYGAMFGKLYNLYAIKHGVTPHCWRVATKEDFDRMIVALGTDSLAKRLKALHSWNNDWSGNNKSGFAALGAGCRNPNGTFSYVGTKAIWWIAGPKREIREAGLYFFINYDDKCDFDASADFGFSVRCVRDVTPPFPSPCP